MSTLRNSMEDVQKAMDLDNIEVVSFPSHPHVDGIEHMSTQDLSIAQPIIELQGSPTRFVTTPMSFSSNELMCNMYSKNPCTPTPLHEVLGPGPWFSMTPSHTLAIGPPGCKAVIFQWRKWNLDITPPIFEEKSTLQPCKCMKNMEDVMGKLMDKLKSMNDTYTDLNDDYKRYVRHCTRL